MPRDARQRTPRKGKGSKRDWTYRLENAKIFLYVAEILIIILFVILRRDA